MRKDNRINLSKEDKIRICKLAYDRIYNYKGNKDDVIHFICVAIEGFLPSLPENKKKIKAYEAIPELLKYKPINRDSNNHWFSIDDNGMEERRRVLLSLIKDLEEQ